MSELFGENTSQILERGMVKTSSRLRMLWLSTFRGFKVSRTLKTPKNYSLGRLTYKTSWVLSPKEEA